MDSSLPFSCDPAAPTVKSHSRVSGPRVAFYPCTHSSRRVGLESLCVASELNQGSRFGAQPNHSHSLTDVGQGSVCKPYPSHLKGENIALLGREIQESWVEGCRL